MVRYFPFPPQGFELSKEAKEALIESIKEEVKQKKKEKEKRTERRNHKKNHDHDGQSSITEEHVDRISFPGRPTSSSEGTQTSNKRKRPDDNHGQSKLRMPSKERNEFATSVMEQKACSISRRTNDSLHESKHINGSRPSLPNGVTSSMQVMEMQYKGLLDKLVPGLQDECVYSDNNLEWLFKNQDLQAGKRRRSGIESTSSCSRSLEFLRETGLIVLPYTIPY